MEGMDEDDAVLAACVATRDAGRFIFAWEMRWRLLKWPMRMPIAHAINTWPLWQVEALMLFLRDDVFVLPCRWCMRDVLVAQLVHPPPAWFDNLARITAVLHHGNVLGFSAQWFANCSGLYLALRQHHMLNLTLEILTLTPTLEREEDMRQFSALDSLGDAIVAFDAAWRGAGFEPHRDMEEERMRTWLQKSDTAIADELGSPKIFVVLALTHPQLWGRYDLSWLGTRRVWEWTQAGDVWLRKDTNAAAWLVAKAPRLLHERAWWRRHEALAAWARCRA